ncbi:MAG: SLBB domain-containing protein [Phycisphaerae bacterium]
MRNPIPAALAVLVAAVAGLTFASGCDSKTQQWFPIDSSRWLDPSAVVKAPSRSSIHPIGTFISAADAVPELPPNASLPTWEDLQYKIEDYVIGPTDIVDVSIMDLYESGIETTLRRQVETTGFIDLPLLPQRIKAGGLTKDQLKEAIIKAYSPDIIRNPTVSVTVVQERANTYSVLGSIQRPGTYNLPRKDTRLLDALALAGGISSTNLKYLYVIRPAPAIGNAVEGTTATPVVGPSAGPATLPTLPELPGLPSLPSLPSLPGTESATGPATGPATAPAPAVLPRLAVNGGNGGPPEDKELTGAMRRSNWIYVIGQGWVKVPSEAASQPGEQAKAPVERREDEADPFGWRKLDKSGGRGRVIAINIKKLTTGDDRMNIVIRDNDVIQVPVLDIGEFYIGGEVNRPGVYTLTGRDVTVKMALVAAGNPGPLAEPMNVVLTRRIGDNQEMVIPLDTMAIYRGDENDFFLKPNDVILVGKSICSEFMLVVRNAFRMTYGFGFIYDRNFADPTLSLPGYTLNSRRFTLW